MLTLWEVLPFSCTTPGSTWHEKWCSRFRWISRSLDSPAEAHHLFSSSWYFLEMNFRWCLVSQRLRHAWLGSFTGFSCWQTGCLIIFELSNTTHQKTFMYTSDFYSIPYRGGHYSDHWSWRDWALCRGYCPNLCPGLFLGHRHVQYEGKRLGVQVCWRMKRKVWKPLFLDYSSSWNVEMFCFFLVEVLSLEKSLEGRNSAHPS